MYHLTINVSSCSFYNISYIILHLILIYEMYVYRLKYTDYNCISTIKFDYSRIRTFFILSVIRLFYCANCKIQAINYTSLITSNNKSHHCFIYKVTVDKSMYDTNFLMPFRRTYKRIIIYDVHIIL